MFVLLLIPLVSILLFCTTMYNYNSASNLTLIKINGLVIIIDLKFIMYSVLFFTCYGALCKIDFVDFTTEFEINIITASLWLALYLIYFDNYLYKEYPRLYKWILSLCGILGLFCVITLSLKFFFSFDVINWLISKFYYLNHYWVNIKKAKAEKPDSSSNQPSGSNNNHNSNSDSDLTPEQKKRKRKNEANARYKARNRDKLKEKSKQYYKDNKDKVNKRTGEWKSKNQEKHKESTKKAYKKWVDNNRDTSRTLSKRWRESNPEGVKKNNAISGAKRKAITHENRKDMAQYEGILPENKAMFESWMELNQDELQDLFKKKRIRKDLQNGFEFFKSNPNYYDDLSQSDDLSQGDDLSQSNDLSQGDD